MKHHWRLRRSSVATPDAQQRWDRAYQSLLLWSQDAAPSTKTTKTTTITETMHVQDVLEARDVPMQQDQQEVTHAGSRVCARLDAEPSPDADH